MEKVRLGILGIGNMGSGHIKNIKEDKCPEIKLTAICDKNPDRLDWYKNTYGEIAAFATCEEMLDSGLIDAILVAVPHYDHPKYSIMAMEKGIHVMCEKPAGVYTKQVREMNAVADKCNVKFGMMFNQRTNHIYRALHDIVHSGKYGEIRRTNWIINSWYRTQYYYDSGDWRATWSGEGGGVLLNQCPHQLDLWQWICGMPVKIEAKLQYGKWHDIEVEDDVIAIVEYANGATGIFATTTGDPHGTNRFEITLDGAKVVCDKDQITVYEFDAFTSEHIKTCQSGFGQPKCTEYSPETDGENLQHVAVLNAFAGAILRDEPMTAEGKEGINGLTISNAMHLSSWLNKPIEFPLDEDLYYEELMKRVKTSRRKENVKAVVSDTSGSY